MLGFQNRAREQADKQTAVQVRNALALLNANGEIRFVTDDATYTIANASPYTQTISTSGDPAGPGIVSDVIGSTVQQLVAQLTGAIEVVGTKDIVLTVQIDGEVEVTSP